MKVLLQTFTYRFLCGHRFSFLLGTYLGVDLLGHVVIPRFHSVCTILHAHEQRMTVLVCPHLHQHLLFQTFRAIPSHYGFD